MQCHMDELPDIDTVDQYTGIFVTGSHCSANESQQWIHKESDWLRAFAQHPTTCKLVASCFGCQVKTPACLLHLHKGSKPNSLPGKLTTLHSRSGMSFSKATGTVVI